MQLLARTVTGPCLLLNSMMQRPCACMHACMLLSNEGSSPRYIDMISLANPPSIVSSGFTGLKLINACVSGLAAVSSGRNVCQML